MQTSQERRQALQEHIDLLRKLPEKGMKIALPERRRHFHDRGPFKSQQR